MGDVLSQAEIDELLRGMAAGDVDTNASALQEKSAAHYDFARPQKINKDQTRTLEIMYDSYCRNLASFLSGYLRTQVFVNVISAEQVTFSEFTNSLNNPCILSICEFSPLKGSVILEVSPNIGYAIIDRILGGPGTGISKMRDFSEIEKILLERVAVHMLNHLPEAWKQVEIISPRLEKVETNYQFAQIIAPSDMTALVTISIKIGSVEGFMNFCLPISVIDPLIDRLNTRFWFSHVTESLDDNYIEDLEKRIEFASVDVSAVVGRTRIMVSEFVNLSVGDVITLDSYVNQDLEIHVGTLKKFYAKPGISRGKNAIQITSMIKREE
ncbi:MAG: flagellar motor switch protein FliM [Defluviitaleaceae bacterium]|nr:flagellar motor switch protein FliM [Defluviitaleaceae bacterium]